MRSASDCGGRGLAPAGLTVSQTLGMGIGMGMAVGMAIILSACTTVSEPPVVTVSPPPAIKPPVPSVVVRSPPEPLPAASYVDYVLRLTPADQEREIERARVAFNRDRSEIRRLHYAAALALSPSTSTTRRVVAPVLEPLLKDSPGRDTEIHAVATLLMGLIQEQRRGDEMERKLDAMKEIERNLMQRERVSPAAVSTGGKP